MANNEEVTVNKSTNTTKVPRDMKNANIWSPGHNFNSLVNHTLLLNYWT